MKRDFPDKRVLITGGASGLGRALALRFAREGWRVGIADLNEARMQETLAAVQQAGGSGFAQRCDVSRVEDFTALADRVRQEWGGLDVLVNNAGIASGGSVAESRYEDWARQLDINLMGVVRGCKTFVPMLLAGKRGHVVDIASFAGIACPPNMASYNVAKAGVIALSESLRAEVIDEGVDVSVACPSFFKTNLTESFQNPADDWMKQFTEVVMARAKVTAEDVADDIYRAVHEGRFMVITHDDARMQWRLKRAAPEVFYKLVRDKLKQRMAMLKAAQK
ncbi:MAG TPA: SDR family oxidoreductase [Nevskiales bacterium]|nr:SDR family oxidoreductase [Nevskiales bacterium]